MKVRRVLIVCSVCLLLVNSLSCGTLLYPERIGQCGGPLDPKVVALNAIGLLLFVVPGLIAFGVDFWNGTIYLPPGEYACRPTETMTMRPDGTVAIDVGREAVEADNLEATISRLTGKNVPLTEVKATPYLGVEEATEVIRAQSP